MNNKLEELLNLPEHREAMKEVEKEIKAASKELVKQEEIEHTLREFDKVNLALPTVDGLGFASDKEFDELAEKATKAYEYSLLKLKYIGRGDAKTAIKEIGIDAVTKNRVPGLLQFIPRYDTIVKVGSY
jgi:hypothetical protein